MEKGSTDKMACPACVKKAGTLPVVPDSPGPHAVPDGLAHQGWERVLGRHDPSHDNGERLVAVKYRRRFRCCGHCTDVVTMGSTASFFAAAAYVVCLFMCSLECAWACYFRAVLAAVYAGVTVVLVFVLGETLAWASWGSCTPFRGPRF